MTSELSSDDEISKEDWIKINDAIYNKITPPVSYFNGIPIVEFDVQRYDRK